MYKKEKETGGRALFGGGSEGLSIIYIHDFCYILLYINKQQGCFRFRKDFSFFAERRDTCLCIYLLCEILLALRWEGMLICCKVVEFDEASEARD